jgi:PAB1-binding protein PBP1
MKPKNAAAVALGRIRTEKKSAASRINGKLGGSPGTYYALHWSTGRGTRRADTGLDACDVYTFANRAARDAACAAYRAPSHCPTAALEAVPAANLTVRRAIRQNEIQPWNP